MDVVSSDIKGFVRTLTVQCSACGEVHGKAPTSPRMSRKNSQRPPFAVNRRIVDAFIATGLGYGGMEKFGMEMGMKILSQSTWKGHLREIEEGVEDMKQSIISQAHAAVRKWHGVGPTDSLDIDVQYDGTWQKRGHVSLNGAGFVIHFETGLVLDYDVRSKYCHICTMTEATMEKEAFEQWLITHKELGECQANHSGSAGAMEAASAVTMWRRSEEKFNMRYKTMIADGDASTLANLNELQLYGPDVTVVKEECLNHVGKRLTNGLKKIVADCKAERIELGGRGEGRLTENKINQQTSYYRNAIVDYSPDVKAMQQAIMATLEHCSSTDKKPQHAKCPKGEKIIIRGEERDNWCFYKRAKARKEKPHIHTSMTCQLSPLVAKKVKPLYERLSCEKLLSTFTRHATQNANESLHSVVWRYEPKEIFVTRPRMEVGVTRAVADFNMGSLNALSLRRQASNEDVSSISQDLATRDQRRVEQSSKQKERSERKRKRKAQSKQKEAAEKKKKGGKSGYEAGGY